MTLDELVAERLAYPGAVRVFLPRADVEELHDDAPDVSARFGFCGRVDDLDVWCLDGDEVEWE